MNRKRTDGGVEQGDVANLLDVPVGTLDAPDKKGTKLQIFFSEFCTQYYHLRTYITKYTLLRDSHVEMQ